MNPRAYALAEQWAADPERLAALLRQNITDAQWLRLAAALSRQMALLADGSITHEFCLRRLLIEANEINGLVIELVLLPIAEQLVAKEAA